MTKVAWRMQTISNRLRHSLPILQRTSLIVAAIRFVVAADAIVRLINVKLVLYQRVRPINDTYKTAKILFGTSRTVDALPATVACLRHVASYAMQTSEPIPHYSNAPSTTQRLYGIDSRGK